MKEKTQKHVTDNINKTTTAAMF